MNDLRTQLEAALDAALTEDSLKPTQQALKKFFDEFHAEFEDRVRSYMSYSLAAYVEDMAKAAIEAILYGDEDGMRRALSCQQGHWTGRDRNHSVIHGRLFETGAIKLRKQLVEAHVELIKNERILDLEDQVRSLVQQINKAEADRESMWERLRAYER